ncbi:MAG: acyltransferase [Isosphaeraceae bacterium]
MSEPAANVRNPAIDAAKAAAVLIGVFYHAIWFADLSAGTVGPGNGGVSGRIEDAVRAVVVPLFFALAGYTSAGMLARHGLGRYLARRWLRIGLPLALAMVTVVPLYHRSIGYTRPAPPEIPPGAQPTRHHGPMPLGPGFRLRPMAGPPAGSRDRVGPPAPADGAARARAGGPRILPTGPPDAPGPGFGRGPEVPAYRLDFAWFLWYLLAFATIAPALVVAARWLLVKPWPRLARGLEQRAIDRDLAPLALGLLTAPALLLAPGPWGWALGEPLGASAAFPKVLIAPPADMPFYLAYFLAGWWLFRNRIGLPEFGRNCYANLLIGLLAHGAASFLSEEYAWRRGVPHHDLVRYAGFALYAIGSAYGMAGLLGCFLASADRPNRAVRYLAGRSSWIYLVHPPMIWPLIGLLKPLHLPWGAQGLATTAIAAAGSLALYEILAARTPLARLFGPSTPREADLPDPGAGPCPAGVRAAGT